MQRTAYAGDMHKHQLQETSGSSIPIKYHQQTCPNCVQESRVYFYIRTYRLLIAETINSQDQPARAFTSQTLQAAL
jgi:hypothetical protein